MIDYISRDLLFKEIEELNAISFYELNDHSNEAYHEIKSLIEHIPAADVVERKTGHWIFNPKDAFEAMFLLPECSECGHESSDAGNYCPNCGARMVNDEV